MLHRKYSLKVLIQTKNEQLLWVTAAVPVKKNRDMAGRVLGKTSEENLNGMNETLT